MRIAYHDLETDVDTMSRNANNWPQIYRRVYPTGRVKWVVDLGKQGNKKRDRRRFDTRAEAEGFAQQARVARADQGGLPFALPPSDQAAAVKLYELLKLHGIDFNKVHEHYATEVIPYLSAPTVAEIVAALIQDVESKRRAATVASLKSILGDFCHRFGNEKITDIKPRQLEEFCFRPGLGVGNSSGTKRNRWAKVSQLYNFAIKKTWATKNLALSLDAPPSNDDHEPAFLTIDEVRRLLAVADEFGLLGYFVLAIFLGIRPTEILRLDWSDVHTDDGFVVVYAAAAKIHMRREVPINPTAAAWLADCRRPSGPIVDAKNFQGRFEAARAAAKFMVWPKDVMRHTFATNHAAAFKNPVETARQMGHIGGILLLKKHYVAYIPETVAHEFWALRPNDLPVASAKEAA